jgi:predicted permease
MRADQPRPPRLARLLLRLWRLGGRRAEVEADLLEQFRLRVAERGSRHAARRYLLDVLSVWRRRERMPGPLRERLAPLADFRRDVLFAMRLFGRRPGVLGVTIIGLGLAIGVSTAVFTLVSAAALLPAGLTDPGSAVRVVRIGPDGGSGAWTYRDFLTLRSQAKTTTLEAMTHAASGFGLRTEAGYADTIAVHVVTGSYLATFGARPVLGRLLQAADDLPGAPPAAVVSEGFWTRRLGGDASVVGRVVRIGDDDVVVVGVANRDFAGPTNLARRVPPALFVTWNAASALYPSLANQGDSAVADVSGRIRPGTARAAAIAELSALAAAMSSDAGPADARRASVRLDADWTNTGLRALAMQVLGALGLVVLLATANMANLLLANATERRREITVRLALGAGRGRVARQLLTEGLLLGGLGAAVGLVVSSWLVPAFASLLGVAVGISLDADLRVYGFAAGVAVVVGGLAGLAPVRYGLRGDLASPAKGIGPSGEPQRNRARAVLVGVQAAASIALLVLASMFVKGVLQTSRLDPGFDVDRVAAVQLRVRSYRCDEACAERHVTQVVDRLRALPDVEGVALAQGAPFVGSPEMLTVDRDGRRYRLTDLARTSAEYFRVMGIAVVRGAAYSTADVAAGARVAVLSESFARQLWPSADPLGATLETIGREYADVRVVGVVTDAVSRLLPTSQVTGVYMPLRTLDGVQVLVRTRAAAEVSIARIHAAAAGIEPDVSVTTRPLRAGVDRILTPIRSVATIASIVSLVSLWLAVVGLYSVTAFVVAQRTHEIGVRMALGASTGDIARLLGSASLRPVLAGLVAGIALAFLGGRLIASTVLGVSLTDPVSVSAAAGLLLLTSLAAIILPTRRAGRIDPAIVLRDL